MRHDLRRGALLIVAAGLIWQLMNALVKQLGSTIPVPELMFFRNLFSLPMVLLSPRAARSRCARGASAAMWSGPAPGWWR